MLAGRPLRAASDALVDTRTRVWKIRWGANGLPGCRPFEGHPKIGDVSLSARKVRLTRHLAGGEQAGVAQADDEDHRTPGRGVIAPTRSASDLSSSSAPRARAPVRCAPARRPAAQQIATTGAANRRRGATQDPPAATGETAVSQITTHILDTAAGRPAAGVAYPVPETGWRWLGVNSLRASRTTTVASVLACSRWAFAARRHLPHALCHRPYYEANAARRRFIPMWTWCFVSMRAASTTTYPCCSRPTAIQPTAAAEP
jgi:hypothetical protein